MAEAEVLSEHRGVRMAAAVAALALTACQTPPPVATTTASPSPAAAIATATPVPPPRATPSPTPTDFVEPPGIRARPPGALPESFRLVGLELAGHTQLWLVDLDRRRAPAVVASWYGPASPVGDHSIAADGKAVLISAKGTRGRVALYLLRTETGTVVTLFDEPGTIVISPRISPDGQRFAFTRMRDGASSDDGIWTGSTTGGEMRRIVEPQPAASVPRMSVAWSTDSVWLAFTTFTTRSEVALAHREGGPQVPIGEGDQISFRRNPPEVLVAANGPTASRMYTFDLATKKVTEVARADRAAYFDPQWHPTLERFAYAQGGTSGGAAQIGFEVWVRNTDGTAASSVDLGRRVRAPRWSRDGTMLTAIGGGDDSVAGLLELLSGRSIAVLCLRGGTPPADCT